MVPSPSLSGPCWMTVSTWNTNFVLKNRARKCGLTYWGGPEIIRTREQFLASADSAERMRLKMTCARRPPTVKPWVLAQRLNRWAASRSMMTILAALSGWPLAGTNRKKNVAKMRPMPLMGARSWLVVTSGGRPVTNSEQFLSAGMLALMLDWRNRLFL